MIIACPSCETRFEVNAAAFPPGGRKVKCARCAHVWHADSPAGVPSVPVLEEASPAEEEASLAPPTIVAPPANEAAPEMIWAGTDIPPRGAGRIATVGLAAAIVALIAAGLYIFRDTVVAYVPGAAPAYAALGVPVDVTGLDLTIEAQASAAAADGATTLVVTGAVVNKTGDERAVPRIRATIYSQDKRELHSWTFEAGVATLKPGERHEFRQELVKPPADTYQVYAHFAEGAE